MVEAKATRDIPGGVIHDQSHDFSTIPANTGIVIYAEGVTSSVTIPFFCSSKKRDLNKVMDSAYQVRKPVVA